jgi:hypothetical protein
MFNGIFNQFLDQIPPKWADFLQFGREIEWKYIYKNI